MTHEHDNATAQEAIDVDLFFAGKVEQEPQEPAGQEQAEDALKAQEEQVETAALDDVGADDESSGADAEADKDTAAEGRRPRAKKTELSVSVLSSVKAAVKLYEGLLNHDQIDSQLRDEIQRLMVAQRQAMELKLRNEAAPEGEDFDSISKALRRANNKLDSHLDNKAGLSEKAKDAVQEAVEKLHEMAAKIIEIEEAVG